MLIFTPSKTRLHLKIIFIVTEHLLHPRSTTKLALLRDVIAPSYTFCERGYIFLQDLKHALKLCQACLKSKKQQAVLTAQLSLHSHQTSTTLNISGNM